MDSLIKFPNKDGFPGEIPPGTLTSSFLDSPILEILDETIEREYNDLETPRHHYPVVVMPTPAPSSSSPQRIGTISAYPRRSRCRTEQPLHHFVKYRLGVDGLYRAGAMPGGSASSIPLMTGMPRIIPTTRPGWIKHISSIRAGIRRELLPMSRTSGHSSQRLRPCEPTP